ncbi:hypothetical protein H5410_038896 [Solanum commersonii]|uniref:Uncharacterized protein n=1 Tax=Solanum commersonii TaxID=4109 RepID=A0A9J5YDJ6_SOLCO|nr:hypothetical protein H5410_038896 [Solanum commersonii]
MGCGAQGRFRKREGVSRDTALSGKMAKSSSLDFQQDCCGVCTRFHSLVPRVNFFWETQMGFGLRKQEIDS